VNSDVNGKKEVKKTKANYLARLHLLKSSSTFLRGMIGKKKQLIFLLAALILVLVFGALAYRANAEIKEADGAVKCASEANASHWAPNEFDEARKTLDDARKAFSQLRFPRSYQLAQRAKFFGEEARTEAIGRRKQETKFIEELKKLLGLRTECFQLGREFTDYMWAAQKKIEQNKKASDEWDKEWDERLATYERRYGQMEKHNEGERRKEAESFYYDYWVDEWYYTYIPDYWEYPDYPNEPARIKLSFKNEIDKLRGFCERINFFKTRVINESEGTNFKLIFEHLLNATLALHKSASYNADTLSQLIVTDELKGALVDLSLADTLKTGEEKADVIAMNSLCTEQIRKFGLDLEDKERPEVSISFPFSGKVITCGSPLEISIHANDNVEVKEVRAYLNNSLCKALKDPPYRLSWMPKISGDYEIRAEAEDISGNVSESHTIVVGVVEKEEELTTPFWTVVVASLATSEGLTESDARKRVDDMREKGWEADVLYSNDFSSLNSGYWVVFSGRFSDKESAIVHAKELKAVGYKDSYQRWVKR